MDVSRGGSSRGTCPGERVGGDRCIAWGDACCLAERGSKAPGSKYLPRMPDTSATNLHMLRNVVLGDPKLYKSGLDFVFTEEGIDE